jgi:hypothetical protein
VSLFGRSLSQSGRPGSAGVAIVSESMAKRSWPNENPIGKRVVVADGIKPESREIVGVVSDTLSLGLASEVQLEIIRRRILSPSPARFKERSGPS